MTGKPYNVRLQITRTTAAKAIWRLCTRMVTPRLSSRSLSALLMEEVPEPLLFGTISRQISSPAIENGNESHAHGVAAGNDDAVGSAVVSGHAARGSGEASVDDGHDLRVAAAEQLAALRVVAVLASDHGGGECVRVGDRGSVGLVVLLPNVSYTQTLLAMQIC